MQGKVVYSSFMWMCVTLHPINPCGGPILLATSAHREVGLWTPTALPHASVYRSNILLPPFPIVLPVCSLSGNIFSRRPTFTPMPPDTFGPHVVHDPDTGRATIDWKKPESMRALTKVMLKHDFGIDWNVPLDRLCPPVPNRLNYICWLSDLMKLRQMPSKSDSPVEGTEAMSTEAERNLFLFGTSVTDGDGDGGEVVDADADADADANESGRGKGDGSNIIHNR